MDRSSLSRRDLLKGVSSLAAASLVGSGTADPAGATPNPATGFQGFPRKADFAMRPGVTYLNGAYTHPMPLPAREAVRRYLEARTEFYADSSPDPNLSGKVKAEFAALINARPNEISFVPNTSTGEVLVVHGLGIPGSGGNVVTDALHFEGAIVHLQSLARDGGLDLRIAMPRDDFAIHLEDLARLVDRNTRLIEISSAAMYNGFEHDLKAVADLAHAHGAYVYVDLIQSAGATPIDVKATGIDFCACAGFKWLMGDLGLGFLYVREELLDRVIRRTQVGYHSVDEYGTHFLPNDPPAATPFTWAFGGSASAHFEVGSVSGAARAALGASIPYLRMLGVDRIEAHRQPLLDRLRRELPRLGHRCVTPEGTRSPLITFAIDDAAAIRDKVTRAGVDVRVATTYLRVSPSVYNDLADVDRLLNALS
ncbi:MAG: aminotransferase class V-fold PLP-dependent enzyme [Gemmatimonadales bacterium]